MRPSPRPCAAGKKIGDEGAKELAAALKTNTTLTELNLRSACSRTLRSLTLRSCTRNCGAPPECTLHTPLAAPTARAPRVPQKIASVSRGLRGWPPGSRPTLPSLIWTSAVRAVTPPHPAAPQTPTCRKAWCPPSTRHPHPPRPSTPARTNVACAPHAAENQIGPDAAEELGAALNANMSLTTLDISSARSRTLPPLAPPRAYAHAQGAGCRTPLSIHRTRLPCRQCALSACCRKQTRRRGRQEARLCAQQQRLCAQRQPGPHQAEPHKCVQRALPLCGLAGFARAGSALAGRPRASACCAHIACASRDAGNQFDNESSDAIQQWQAHRCARRTNIFPPVHAACTSLHPSAPLGIVAPL